MLWQLQLNKRVVLSPAPTCGRGRRSEEDGRDAQHGDDERGGEAGDLGCGRGGRRQRPLVEVL